MITAETPRRRENIIAGFSRPFWTFLFAENLYDFGLYVFVLLYNLYLLDLGYREDFLGWIASAMTAGSIVGSLPSASVARWLGLKRMLIWGSAGMAVLCAVRALPLGGPGLLAAAFVAGVISSVWAVSLAPVVAALTTEKNRAAGFSLWSGWGIGLGILCGALAGALPGWILRSGVVAAAQDAKQVALFFGAAFALLSPILLVRLPLGRGDGSAPRTFPRSPFVVRYMTAFVFWNLAVGAFNPFFSAYFARQVHLSVKAIGVVFSISQAVQLAALLATPAILRRLGTVNGIACIQAGMALSLGVLALNPKAMAAAGAYAAFMAFQCISEPGTFTLLMNGVAENERAGVSALNFFVMSAAQAASSGVAGMAVTRYGYAPVLASAAAIAAVAALLFRVLLEDSGRVRDGIARARPEAIRVRNGNGG
ncbi:MAG TPA: MFS transporter [Candidatus Sulfopaludibacter sp.]|nr:MFS transporter [Candidatus Sulfopaludibacter sp.]